MGKIVTAYNSGQCNVNSAHSWESGDEIYWHKFENNQVVTCNNKACFLAQHGECDGIIKTEPKPPEPPKMLDKHTGKKTTEPQHPMDKLENIEDDGQLHEEISKGPPAQTERPQAKSMDVVDIAAQRFEEKYTTHAKELQIIEKVLNKMFPGMEGQERGMKTKLLWDAEHQ